jgi:hypothetical protein
MCLSRPGAALMMLDGQSLDLALSCTCECDMTIVVPMLRRRSIRNEAGLPPRRTGEALGIDRLA